MSPASGLRLGSQASPPDGAMSIRRTSRVTASRRLESRDGDLGLLWWETRPTGEMMGWGPEKEPLLGGSICLTNDCRRQPRRTPLEVVGHVKPTHHKVLFGSEVERRLGPIAIETDFGTNLKHLVEVVGQTEMAWLV